jgi:hypothetical protein
MTDLGDLFDQAQDDAARAAGEARLEGDEFGEVRTRVRRAHSRRAVLRTFIVAGAAFAVGAVAVTGLKYVGTSRVGVSPTPSAPVSASPSPSASDASAGFPAFTGVLTQDPHLPQASPITADVWAAATPGWALISYREAWMLPDRWEAGPQVIYLVSPAGERYELSSVPGDTLSVLAWDVGSTTAAVSVQPEAEPPYEGLLNLVTGAVTRMDGYAPSMYSLAFLDDDGAPVWMGDDSTYSGVKVDANANESQFAFTSGAKAAEIAVNHLNFPGIDCGEVAPYDAESTIVSCWDNRFTTGGPIEAADARLALVRAWPADDRVEVLYESTYATPRASKATRAGDFVLASTGGTGLDGCATDYSIIAGGKATPVPGWDATLHPSADSFLAFGATGNSLVWGATTGCEGDATPVAVVRSDLDSGTYAVLMPLPQGRPANEEPYRSVTGVAVGR